MKTLADMFDFRLGEQVKLLITNSCTFISGLISCVAASHQTFLEKYIQHLIHACGPLCPPLIAGALLLISPADEAPPGQDQGPAPHRQDGSDGLQ